MGQRAMDPSINGQGMAWGGSRLLTRQADAGEFLGETAIHLGALLHMPFDYDHRSPGRHSRSARVAVVAVVDHCMIGNLTERRHTRKQPLGMVRGQA